MACEPHTGLARGSFIKALLKAQDDVFVERAQNDVVVGKLLALVYREPFESTVQELFDRIAPGYKEPTKNFPATPQHLSKHLARLKPAMAKAGLGISRRCVQYSVKALVKQSHLEVTSGQAAGVGNVYRAKVKDGAGTVVPTPSEGHAPVCRPGRHHDARGAGTTVPTSTSSLSLSNSGSGLPGFMKKIPATRRANSDAGQIQKDIAARLGANGWEIVMSLEESEVDQLCAQQRAGTLSEASLAEIKLVYEASQSARSALLKRSVG